VAVQSRLSRLCVDPSLFAACLLAQAGPAHTGSQCSQATLSDDDSLLDIEYFLAYLSRSSVISLVNPCCAAGKASKCLSCVSCLTTSNGTAAAALAPHLLQEVTHCIVVSIGEKMSEPIPGEGKLLQGCIKHGLRPYSDVPATT
jgi:hypothetical protein